MLNAYGKASNHIKFKLENVIFYRLVRMLDQKEDFHNFIRLSNALMELVHETGYFAVGSNWWEKDIFAKYREKKILKSGRIWNGNYSLGETYKVERKSSMVEHVTAKNFLVKEDKENILIRRMKGIIRERKGL